MSRVSLQAYSLIPELSTVTTGYFDAFEYRKDRPLRWLQRLCLWTLRKIGCWRLMPEKFTKVAYREFDEGDVAKDLLRMIDGLRDLLGDGSDYVIFAGRDDLYRVLQQHGVRDDCEEHFPWSFTMNLQQDLHGRRSAFGVPVVSVPWMQGWVVLPISWLRAKQEERRW